MADTASGIYHPRNPTDSPLWNLLNNHYDDFEKHYEEKYEKKYGYFRPVINEVVTEYLKCGEISSILFPIANMCLALLLFCVYILSTENCLPNSVTALMKVSLNFYTPLLVCPTACLV